LKKETLFFRALLAFSLFIIAVEVEAQPLAPSTTITYVQAGYSADQERRGVAVPLALSALLPGSGERLYNAHGRAAAFLTSELTLWVAFWWSYTQKERALANAYSYAARYAGASPAAKDNPALLQAIADYRSRGGVNSLSSSPHQGDDYNQEMIRSGKEIDLQWADAPEYSWDWGNTEAPENEAHWENYKEMVSSYRLYKISFQAFAGGLLLNRLLSLVDVLQLHRTGGKQPTARILPSGVGSGAELLITF